MIIDMMKNSSHSTQSSTTAKLPSSPYTWLMTMVQDAWSFNRWLTASTLFSFLLILPVLIVMWLDPVTINGVNGWIKPLKFLISSAIYTATFLWLLTHVHGWQRLVQFTASFAGFALIVENGLIILQVIRRTSSHFNVGTLFDGAIFSTMGFLIFTLAFLNILVAVRILWQKMDERIFGWALRLGLLTTVAGMLVATLMTSPTTAQLEKAQQTGEMPIAGAHSVGVEDGGPGLPLVGWSTEGGDLRIPHFVGLHALQIIPLVGWLLSRRRAVQRWSEGQRVKLVWIAGLGYAAWMGLLTWQALRGQSIIAPDPITVAAFASLLAAIVVAALVVARQKQTSSFE